MKRLGQHFLRNKNTLRQIAELVAADPNETIIEIGPGHGELSEFLFVAYPESEFILIERDSKLASRLSHAIAGRKNVRIIAGDALKVLPENIPATPVYRVVGNIPYYITGYLLRVLQELPRKPSQITLLLQKDVAERLIARPPRMNKLAASVQFWADISLVKTVPKGDFQPPPEVESAVVKIVPHARHDNENSGAYYEAVNILFRQPRKTILNNLAEAASLRGDKGAFMHMLEKSGFDPKMRPQNLGVEAILQISKQIKG